MSIGSSTSGPGRSGMRLAPRRPSAKERLESERALQRFVRLEHWNGLSAGDVVRVTGHSSRGRHWRFRAHVTNTSNGASWVEVALVEGPAPSKRPVQPTDEEAGSEPRVERIRSFEPSLVSPRWSRLGGRRARRAAASGGGGEEEQVTDEAAQPEAARLF